MARRVFFRDARLAIDRALEAEAAWMRLAAVAGADLNLLAEEVEIRAAFMRRMRISSARTFTPDDPRLAAIESVLHDVQRGAL